MSRAAQPADSAVRPEDLPAAAAAAGLRVLAAGRWPRSAADLEPPVLPGFVASSFSPLAAEAARRCLDAHQGGVPAELPVTAVVVASELGDLAGAVQVAEAVDGGARLGPLLFFQAVPNAVAGHLAARRGLTGPVVCVGGAGAGLEVAELLLADGDAELVLLVLVEQAAAGPDGGSDRAAAVLLAPPPLPNRPGHLGHLDQPGHPGHPDRPDHPDHPDRLNRPDHPDHPSHPNHLGRPGHPDRQQEQEGAQP
ncbi:beta-ketoacyl synthase chain length factor [Kitasatospora cineracea]|uniref:Beta-ketoacyl synthase-like protein n=1 Tax=Kitasatospora cineracea TaxID=88074 RepID=A0A8G1UA73_9ACTN|nr:beta-ketoacyl synthase chain length factor [Kitasatospora cineracea]ROR35709.1 beta-ketoacyl synthase-like protein [Kitasatospora cineracea]